MAEQSNITYPSRRAMLAGIPAAAIGVGALASAIAIAGATELLAAEKTLADLSAQFVATDDHYWEVWTEAKKVLPKRPGALVVRCHDVLGVGAARTRDPETGAYREFYSDKSVEALRAGPRMRQEFIGTQEDWNGADFQNAKFWAPVLDEKNQRRAEEVIAAHDAWTSECKRIEAGIGLTALEVQRRALSDRKAALLASVKQMPALTLDAVRAKARIALEYIDFDDEEFVENFLREVDQLPAAA